MSQVDLEELITELRADADQAAWYIGFMNSVINESELIAERLNDSFSGYAGAIAQTAVKAGLILYCARAWDTADNSVSLRRTISELPTLDELVERRRGQLAALGIDLDEAGVTSRHDRLMEAYHEAELSADHDHIRLLRTEYFAHRVVESRERGKLTKAGVVVAPVTYNGLLKLATSTVKLVGEIGYLWDRLSNPYPDRIARAERCCREFWRNVPILRDAETPIA